MIPNTEANLHISLTNLKMTFNSDYDVLIGLLRTLHH